MNLCVILKLNDIVMVPIIITIIILNDLMTKPKSLSLIEVVCNCCPVF